MDRRCGSETRINQSRHSRRIVPITRSQMALAFGVVCDYSNALAGPLMSSGFWVRGDEIFAPI